MNPTETYDLHKAIKTSFTDVIHTASPQSKVTFENDKRNGVFRATITRANEATSAREALKAQGFNEQTPTAQAAHKDTKVVTFDLPTTKQTRNTLQKIRDSMTAPVVAPTAITPKSPRV
jgi:hypothetical protein